MVILDVSHEMYGLKEAIKRLVKLIILTTF